MGALCLTACQSEPPSETNDSQNKSGPKKIVYPATLLELDSSTSGKVEFVSADPDELSQASTPLGSPLREIKNHPRAHSQDATGPMPERKPPSASKLWKEGGVYNPSKSVDKSSKGGDYSSDMKSRVPESGKLSFFPRTGSSSEFERKDVVNWVPSRQPPVVDVFPDDSSIRVYEQTGQHSGFRDSKGTSNFISAFGRKRAETAVNEREIVVYEHGPAEDHSSGKYSKSNLAVNKTKEDETKKLHHHLMIMKQEREKLRDLGSQSPDSVSSPSRKPPSPQIRQAHLVSRPSYGSESGSLDYHSKGTNDSRVGSKDMTPNQKFKLKQDQVRIQRIKNLLGGQNANSPSPIRNSIPDTTGNHRNAQTAAGYSPSDRSPRAAHHLPPRSDPSSRSMSKTPPRSPSEPSSPMVVQPYYPRSSPTKFSLSPSVQSPTSPIEVALPIAHSGNGFEFPAEVVFSSDYTDSIPAAECADLVDEDAQDLVFIEAPTVNPISVASPMHHTSSNSDRGSVSPAEIADRSHGSSYDSIPVAPLRFSHTPPGTDTELSDSEALFAKHSRTRSHGGAYSTSNVRNPLVYEESDVVEFSTIGINNANFMSMESTFSEMVPLAEEAEADLKVADISHSNLTYMSSIDEADIYVAQALETEPSSDSVNYDPTFSQKETKIPISSPVYSSRSSKDDSYGRRRRQEEEEASTPARKSNLMPFHPKPIQPLPMPIQSPKNSPRSPQPSTPTAEVVSDDLYNQSSGGKKTSKVAGWFFKSKDKSSMSSHTANILQRPLLDIREYYLIYEEELGRGRFGIIHVCICRETGERLACKSIRKSKLKCPQDVEDVRREVRVMEMLRGHPHIVHLKDTFEDSRFVHLVMELCEGGELFDRIKLRARYTEPKARSVIRTVVEVLRHCHSLGIMHRDLKPENILLCNWDSDTTVKVIDYGVAAIFKKGKYCTDIAGSPFYLAPEVLKEKYGPEADVWSAGVVLYILLSGVPPFWAPTNEGIFEAIKEGKANLTREPWPRISPEAKDLVSAMLTKDPKRRISVDEILAHPWLS